MEAADVPAEFDVRTLVLLVRPADAPDLGEEERTDSRTSIFATAQAWPPGADGGNGPFTDQADPALRGMSVYTVGPEEARALAEQDPSVRAGRLRPLVVRWWTRAGQIDVARHTGPVGDRRSLADLD